jgi:GTPase SAR1 family protein
MTGKTKIKIVFLGSQSVGKSSIIEKYIHDRFEETANVFATLLSPQLESTS